MSQVKKILVFLTLSVAFFIIGWWANSLKGSSKIVESVNQLKPRPFNIYTIENLSNSEIKPGKIETKEAMIEENDYTSYLFSFEFNPNLDGKTLKKTTGQLNLPTGDGPFPVVVMFRGYIDQEIYKTGDGTRRAAEFFAENGFITIAPDFLGYAGSDKESPNIFEARFQTYVTVLSLIKSLSAIEHWNTKTIFLWGHSNGGQIALTVLEITRASYPTTLWAPVSKQFPYSVLYYTDQSEDRGKLIRKELSEFEKEYNPDLYSLDLYLDRINAPLQIQQGTKDDAVPVSWSDELSKNLEELEKDVTYYKYGGADHNMVPSWETIVKRDLDFYKNHLK